MSMRPVPAIYGITQSYYGTFSNQFQGGALHGATDFGTPVGTPILAPDDLTILHAGWAYDLPGGPADFGARWWLLKPPRGDQKGGGGIIVLGANANGWVWYDAHLSSTHLNVGDKVRKGDVVGLSGVTGIATGPHTHIGMIPANPNVGNGAYGAVDMMPFIDETYAPNQPAAWSGGPTKGKRSATKPTPSAPVERKRYDLITDLTGNRWAGRGGAPLLGWVIHWWDDPKKRPTLTGTRAWFKNPVSEVSAHYVVEDGTVVQMVQDGDTAWHAGSRYWNERTIGIECNPRMTTGDLETVAQLVADLETKHGSKLVYRHSDVNPGTQCPGAYGAKIDWLINRVNQIKAAGVAGTVSRVGASGVIERMLSMSQADFDREKGKAHTPEWFISNGRDHAANAAEEARKANAQLVELTKMLRGTPAAVLQAEVRRSDSRGKTEERVSLGRVASYDRQNWQGLRATQEAQDKRLDKIESTLGQLVELLTAGAPAQTPVTPAEGK